MGPWAQTIVARQGSRGGCRLRGLRAGCFVGDAPLASFARLRSHNRIGTTVCPPNSCSWARWAQGHGMHAHRIMGATDTRGVHVPAREQVSVCLPQASGSQPPLLDGFLYMFCEGRNHPLSFELHLLTAAPSDVVPQKKVTVRSSDGWQHHRICLWQQDPQQH